MTSLSIIIPTFRRPDGVLRAANSVLRQNLSAFARAVRVELIIVDNCPEGSAARAIAALQVRAPMRVIGVAEPSPGVSNARNAGWARASGELIAFLDDDQEADPLWVQGLVDAHRQLGAPVIFGPVRARLEGEPGKHDAFVRQFWSRPEQGETRLLETYFGCGNCLIDRAELGLEAPPFDVDDNEVGGEDDRLFGMLERRGVVFGWASQAPVAEVVPAERARLAYVLRKSFAYGQGPAQDCALADPPRILGVVFWMAVGLAQSLVFGVAMLAAWLVQAPARARLLDRTVQGLGKIFWMRAFQPRFYGAASIAAKPASPPVPSPEPAGEPR